MSNLVGKKKKKLIPNSKKSQKSRTHKKPASAKKDVAIEIEGNSHSACANATQQQAVGILVNMREELNQIEARYRQSLYELLARAYKLAQGLRRSPTTSRLFWESPHWGNRSQRSGKNARCNLNVVLRFLCPDSVEGSKAASFYYRALGPLFRERVPDEEVIDRIKSMGGLREMAAEAAKEDHFSEPVVSSSSRKSVRNALAYKKRANACLHWDGPESNKKGVFQGLGVGDEFQLTGVIESLQDLIALRVKSLSRV